MFFFVVFFLSFFSFRPMSKLWILFGLLVRRNAIIYFLDFGNIIFSIILDSKQMLEYENISE